MTRTWLSRTAVLVVLTLPASAPGLRAADKDGTLVELGNLKSRTPASWIEEKVTSQMRLAQFRLPKADGGKNGAEVVIFQGISGSTKDNIERWKNQFIPPEGQTAKDAAKVTETKISGADVTILDVRGTYKFKARPFDPNSKEERRPDYRMLGVVFELDGKPYHIRFVGQAKTVDHFKKGFDDWLRAFK